MSIATGDLQMQQQSHSDMMCEAELWGMTSDDPDSMTSLMAAQYRSHPVQLDTCSDSKPVAEWPWEQQQ